MQAFWLFILALILSTSFGVLIYQDPGYALFAYQNWTAEMPLWLAFALMGLLGLGLYAFFWTIHTLASGSATMRHWYKGHQLRNARLESNKGLLALAEGQWQRAERHLAHSAAHSEDPLINYLYAAKAAQALGARDRRDHYLDLAFELDRPSVSVRLTRAASQLKEGHFEASTQSLTRLYQDEPKNPEVLRLLAELYQNTQDFMSLYKLLPVLRKQAVFDKQGFERLEQRTYQSLITVYANKGAKALIQFFSDLPRAMQQNPSLVHDYANALIKLDAFAAAEKILRLNLSRQWNNRLIHLYGLLQSPNPQAQQRFAESFLGDHPADPVLLLSLGRICMAHQQWQQAKDYCERSLRLQASPETYAVLGQLMEASGLYGMQHDYFKRGLLLATEEAASTTVGSDDQALTYQE